MRYSSSKIKAARKRRELACPVITHTNTTRRAAGIAPKTGGAKCHYGHARPHALSLAEAVAWSDDAHLWAWSRQVD